MRGEVSQARAAAKAAAATSASQAAGAPGQTSLIGASPGLDSGGLAGVGPGRRRPAEVPDHHVDQLLVLRRATCGPPHPLSSIGATPSLPSHEPLPLRSSPIYSSTKTMITAVNFSLCPAQTPTDGGGWQCALPVAGCRLCRSGLRSQQRRLDVSECGPPGTQRKAEVLIAKPQGSLKGSIRELLADTTTHQRRRAQQHQYGAHIGTGATLRGRRWRPSGRR